MSALRALFEAIFGPLNAALGSLPLGVAPAFVALLLILPLVWVLRLGRASVFRGAPDEAWWRDLRLWAVVVTLPYLVIYLWL